MDGKGSQSSMARRLLLARVGAGVVGATIASSPAAMARVAKDSTWRPTRHAQDDWLDKIPGQHRLVFDTTSRDGMASALRFADNYYIANANGYGLRDGDLAVLIVARHKSTPFGYNDAIWAKYGKQLSELGEYSDPKTKEPLNVNIYSSNQAGRLDGLIKRGARVAVCQMSSREIAASIAKDVGGSSDAILNEIGANLVASARFVPAGIVAVNRAQEHGYSLVCAV